MREKFGRFMSVFYICALYNVIDYNYFITEQLTWMIREVISLCIMTLQSWGNLTR